MKIITSLFPTQINSQIPYSDNKNYTTKPFGNLNLSPLNCDMVSFQGANNSFSTRCIGDPYKFYDSTVIKNFVYKNVPILEDKKFGQKEYGMLVDKNKEFLNEIIERGYGSSLLRNIKDDAGFLITISNKMRSVWDNEHPEGYHLCLLGGSPSVFERIMTYQGHKDVSNIPFTTAGAKADIDYAKFFSKFGLTKESVEKTDKPIIFFDYFLSPVGDKYGTLDKLIESLSRAKINIKPDRNRAMNMHLGKNLIVDSFGRVLYGTNKFMSSEAMLMDEYFLFESHIKSYATCPRMDSAEHFKNVDKIKDEYEWSLSAKLMNFALLDKLMAK